MRSICIINNYNYERYLEEALHSARNQSVPFDLILIVDDGSTDGSRALIERFCSETPRAQALFKRNGGQLSCFNEAVRFVEPDDLVTFLDSDDVYAPNYLELLTEKVQQYDASFFFCEPVTFSDSDLPLKNAATGTGSDFVLPCTSALTRHKACWIGSPTSCIAVRGHLYLQLVPYPHEADWRTRADDVLVYGASLLGALKTYMPTLGVAYRVHGNNSFFGRRYDKRYEISRRHKLEKLFGWYCEQQSIAILGRRRVAAEELWLIPEHLLKRFNLPSRRKMLSWFDRIRYERRLRRHEKNNG